MGNNWVSPLSAELPRHQLGWRMAVLPFRSLGVSAGLGIALGMAEEVSAALTRYCAPRLIATATFWDGSGPAADAMARCRAYQLDYIIDGTIHVVEDEIHVDVTLLDVVLDFEVIWRGRFEEKLNDLFSLQHRIAFDTVMHVDPELLHRGAGSDVLVKTEVAAAHQSLLTAIQGIFRLDQSTFMRARELLARAIELDPDYAAAHGWMAYWSIIAAGQGWVENPRDVTTLAGSSAERAIELDPFNARAVAIAGHVKAYLLHDVRSALQLHARATELNPNLPIAWTMSSWSRIYNGEHSTAVRHAMMSQSLSPRDPHIWFVEHALMTAQLFNRNLEEAEMLSEAVLERNPGHVSALNIRLAILGHMKRAEDARQCLALLRKFDPNVTVERISSRIPLRLEDKIFYIEGLERAGVPR
jgi:TolB-like protein